MGVHVFPLLKPFPPPSSSHPSGSSQCTSPEHPVSCIEPGLAIHFTYDNIHVSVPFSQTIPPLPSPTESKRLFYTSVSPLLSRIFSCLVEAGASINGKQIDNICVSFAVSHMIQQMLAICFPLIETPDSTRHQNSQGQDGASVSGSML